MNFVGLLLEAKAAVLTGKGSAWNCSVQLVVHLGMSSSKKSSLVNSIYEAPSSVAFHLNDWNFVDILVPARLVSLGSSLHDSPLPQSFRQGTASGCS